jgi:uncharacterized 2Fe-2S/4Fe-4S cluster protein (DUF4445 family)
MSIFIHFDGQSSTVKNDDDLSILELARAAGHPLDVKCGGRGSCGSCTVILGEGRYRVFTEEIEVLPEQRREVPACQSYVLSSSANIFLPHASVIAFDAAQIADDITLPPLLRPSPTSTGFGIAVDVGTTTVVAALIDFSTGEILARESRYNQQILKADDVVSRISLCSDPDQLTALHELVIRHSLNPLIQKLCDECEIDPNEIHHLVAAGNPVMMHLFFGVSPASIGVIPFKPAQYHFSSTAAELGISIHPEAIVEDVPAISGYVGGDITADLQISQLTKQTGLSVLIDIGTNGEMVAALDGQMTACATAAGPAFEGAGLLHGARAANRAIETITFDQNLDFNLTVIGDPVPMGICGSAIIDFIAEGFRCGLINLMGRYDVERLKEKGCYEQVAGMHACILVDAETSATGESITVTEHDIAEILKAKAAIYAGLKTLLAELGKTVHEVDRIILAGGFAKHINLRNAITLGLLPDLELKQYEIIGNGSLSGAVLMLLDPSVKKAFGDVAQKPHIVTLNQTDFFTNYFQEALAIPNLETADFPSVRCI